MNTTPKNNRHSIYYNDDARTVLKKYRLRRRIIILIYTLLTLAYLILMITQALIYSKYILILCFPLWFIFRGVCMLMIQLQLTPVLNIFYKDCDPEKLYEVLDIFKLRRKSNNNIALVMLYKAWTCYFIPERQAEGLALIKEIHFIKPTLIFEQMRLLCTAYYAKHTQDKEWFSRTKSEFENLPNLHSFKKSNIRLQEQYRQRLRVAELMWNLSESFPLEKAEEIRTLLNKLLSLPNNALQETAYHFYFAKLDMAVGEYQNAKAHLQCVAFYGGKLPLTAEADTMLKECEQLILSKSENR